MSKNSDLRAYALALMNDPESNTQFQIIQEKPYTCAVIKIGNLTGRGFAKWNPSDAGDPEHDWDAGLGQQIAIGRAFINLSRSVLESAQMAADAARAEILADSMQAIGIGGFDISNTDIGIEASDP